MRKSKKYIIVTVLFLCFSLSVKEMRTEENYCTDKDSWKEWDALAEKYPDDMDIQTLHALRLGLCAKVERGDITVEQATEIFENARKTIISKKKSESHKDKKSI